MWLINEELRIGNYKYNIYLNVDKELNPFDFKYPAIWTGTITGDINNVFGHESGEIVLKQVDRNEFEKIKFPEFASFIYEKVVEKIHVAMKRMD